jgi:hypothetical protein
MVGADATFGTFVGRNLIVRRRPLRNTHHCTLAHAHSPCTPPGTPPCTPPCTSPCTPPCTPPCTELMQSSTQHCPPYARAPASALSSALSLRHRARRSPSPSAIFSAARSSWAWPSGSRTTPMGSRSAHAGKRGSRTRASAAERAPARHDPPLPSCAQPDLNAHTHSTHSPRPAALRLVDSLSLTAYTVFGA